MLIIGPHVNREKESIIDSIKESIKNAPIDIRVVAIFVGQTRARVIILKEDEQIELKKFIHDSKVKVIAHSSYVASPWNGNPAAITYIKKEINVCCNAGISGLVVHLPKKDSKTVIKYLTKLDLDEEIHAHFTIYLETPAVIPKETYYETPEKINALFKEIHDAKFKLQYGICVDTAHIWTSGESIQSYESAKEWFSKLKVDKIMIHLNDSARPLGTGPDKHESLMKGYIWRDYRLPTIVDKYNLQSSNKHKKIDECGIHAILEFAKENSIPIILERPSTDMLVNDYEILLKIKII